MTTETVQLGFKSFDIHELLCHCVAVHTGAYERHGLRVSLLDTTFIADEQLGPDVPQVACGAALAAWLRGAPLKVVFVATDRPLFWLYGRPGVSALAALRGGAIAGFPVTTPPAQLLKVVLGKAGMDPARDVRIVYARDDAARIGLLLTGDADAAVIGSAVPPATMARLGCPQLVFFGDSIRLPTTGLAVHADLAAHRPQVVAGLRAALGEALTCIHADAEAPRAVLASRFRIASADIEPTLALVRACFTRDGRTTPAIANAAVAAMAGALGIVAPPPAAQLYG